jgi:zinc protease
MEKRPVEQAVLLMQFDTDPEKQEKLIGIIHKEIQEIIANGPREEDLTKTKEILLKSFKEQLEENSAWSKTYLPHYYNNNLNYIRDFQKIIENITDESIVATLKAIVEQGNVVEVVMMPAK